jgi:pyruvate dehydrogenase E1 component alpha subunit|tara:strand:- start:5194 stop:6138 length:945 start_codon:yes stop_codon:yes gene_type:complete
MMNKIRAFEETAAMANEEGLVLGAIHLSIGQESIASGVCQNLEKDDFLLSTHRGHGHTLAKGANPQSMMLELLGRKGGICRGKGGSMHIADFSVGMLGANGVVSANINIAAGAGHAIKLKGGNNISCCIFGDGAINRGPFLEGLNWAGVFRLPVLFVCEKNGFASTTATEAMTSGAGSKDRAESLGIPSEEIDGNDIVAVDECVRKNINEIRSGGGPRFILCNTYRLHGHTASDPALYRDQKDVDEAWKNDPIANCKELLKNAGVIEKDLTGHRDDALAEMQKIYDSAKRAPWPDLQLAYEDVQDSGDPRERAY